MEWIRIQAVEINYLRGVCGLNRMDGESNKSVYNKFVMSVKNEGINCGVVEVVKCSNLRWFAHLERKGDELTKRIIVLLGGITREVVPADVYSSTAGWNCLLP